MGLLVSFFCESCRSVNTLCLFGMSDSLRFKRAVVFVWSSEGRKEAGPLFEWEFAMAGRSGFPFLQR